MRYYANLEKEAHTENGDVFQVMLTGIPGWFDRLRGRKEYNKSVLLFSNKYRFSPTVLKGDVRKEELSYLEFFLEKILESKREASYSYLSSDLLKRCEEAIKGERD